MRKAHMVGRYILFTSVRQVFQSLWLISKDEFTFLLLDGATLETRRS